MPTRFQLEHVQSSNGQNYIKVIAEPEGVQVKSIPDWERVKFTVTLDQLYFFVLPASSFSIIPEIIIGFLVGLYGTRPMLIRIMNQTSRKNK
jgi:hypothetical protein